EPDGLAMSSRNAYLNTEERKAAVVLHRSLEKARMLYEDGERESNKILSVMHQMIEAEPLARIDYIAIVDCDRLEPVTTISENQTTLIPLAVFLGRVRLIDNIILNSTVHEED